MLERDLVGALDLLERDPKGLVVVDLKTAVTFMLSAEELRWLVRRLEAEPPVLGYAPIVEKLITAKGRLAGDEPSVEIRMPANEATVLHEWVFAYSAYPIAARIRRAIQVAEEHQ